MDILKNEQIALDLINKNSLKNGARRYKNVLLLSIWYPLSISRYFEKALQNRADVNLRTIGPYTGTKIPWLGGMQLPIKYAKSPTYPMFNVQGQVPWYMAENLLKDWPVDLVLCIDAGINWNKKPDVKCPVVTIGTDPHVLNYDHARNISDLFVNMQKAYSQPGDLVFPYAFSTFDHYKNKSEKKVDAVLIGMPYVNRVRWVNELRKNGISVAFENGPVFDEYREINNSATIGLNWSSMDDLVARVFELMAMGLCPVINRVPDLPLFFTEGEDYLGFSDMREAIAKVLWAKNNPEDANRIANNAYNKVWKKSTNSTLSFPIHSYSQRIEDLFGYLGI